MSQLDSQRIVIFGGTSGIGLATAQLAAAEGATVVVASSNPDCERGQGRPDHESP